MREGNMNRWEIEGCEWFQRNFNDVISWREKVKIIRKIEYDNILRI